MRQAWFELRCQGFVRLCPTLQGWGGFVGERKTRTRGALEWLTGTVTSGARWLVLHSRMQNGDESLTNDTYIRCDDST